MSLLEAAYETFIFMVQDLEPDSVGSFAGRKWTEGTEFMAAISGPYSTGQVIANALQQHTTCTITTPKATVLYQNDVIKRKEDGLIIKIDTDGTLLKTPNSAYLDMRQSTAHVWTLPEGE